MSVLRFIWKYQLQPGINVIPVTPGARIVLVAPWQPDSDAPGVWIEHQLRTATMKMRLQAVGTGEDIPPDGAHIGSAWCGPYMWHVYELAHA